MILNPWNVPNGGFRIDVTPYLSGMTAPAAVVFRERGALACSPDWFFRTRSWMWFQRRVAPSSDALRGPIVRGMP